MTHNKIFCIQDVCWRKMELFMPVAILKRYELNKPGVELSGLSQLFYVFMNGVEGALAQFGIAFCHFAEQVAGFT
jgi:hypothetical protein